MVWYGMVWCGGAEQFLYSESFYKAVRSQNEEYKNERRKFKSNSNKSQFG